MVPLLRCAPAVLNNVVVVSISSVPWLSNCKFNVRSSGPPNGLSDVTVPTLISVPVVTVSRLDVPPPVLSVKIIVPALVKPLATVRFAPFPPTPNASSLNVAPAAFEKLSTAVFENELAPCTVIVPDVLVTVPVKSVADAVVVPVLVKSTLIVLEEKLADPATESVLALPVASAPAKVISISVSTSNVASPLVYLVKVSPPMVTVALSKSSTQSPVALTISPVAPLTISWFDVLERLRTSWTSRFSVTLSPAKSMTSMSVTLLSAVKLRSRVWNEPSKRKVSVPVPPSMSLKLMSLTARTSSPSPPSMVSLPEPPMSKSSPPLPSRTLSPASPMSVSAKMLPRMFSILTKLSVSPNPSIAVPAARLTLTPDVPPENMSVS